MHTTSSNDLPSLPEALRDSLTAHSNADVLEALWTDLDDPATTATFPTDDTAWADLMARLDAPPTPQPRRAAFADRAARPQARRRTLRWTLVSTGLTFGVLLLGLAWFLQPVVVTMPLGETGEITLPDGSVAHLNSGSQLTYARGFQSMPGMAAATRTVQLEGEGYFSVMHNPEQPFRVQTVTAQVEVLGTRFSIREGDGATEVILAEGKVQVTAPETTANAVRLERPGESALVAASQAPEKRLHTVNVAQALAWREGGFVMIDATVADVLNALQRTFATRITAGDDVALRDTVTLIYQRDATVDGVLRDLCLSLSCTFRASSQGYTLEAR
ncbi:MAG: FecR family protein [Rhodothermales bacterium]